MPAPHPAPHPAPAAPAGGASRNPRIILTVPAVRLVGGIAAGAGWLTAPAGWIGDLQERFIDGEPFINSAVTGFGACDRFRFSSARAAADLGYTIGPLEPAVRDALAWWAQNGMLDRAPRG